MRLLVTGSRGQLGRALERHCRRRAVDCVGVDLPEVDITDPEAALGAVRDVRPDAVVNCAAFTDVDGAESAEAEAMAVNGTAVGHLAAAAAETGALLVQVSTDYVFAGDGERPYREDDPVRPVSAYGRSKLRGETEARTAGEWLIVRTSWLFGEGGRNFIEAIRRQIAAGREVLRVVDDQRGSPSYAADVAWAILRLVQRRETGTVHAANAGSCTWCDLAREVVRVTGAAVEVVPVATEAFPRPAPRPRYSVLDTGRLAGILGAPLPRWETAVARYLDSHESEQ